MRKYKTAKTWAKEVPGARIWLLLTAQGKVIYWHCSEVAPVGRFTLIGVIE